MDHLTTAHAIITDRVRKSGGYVYALNEVCSRVKFAIEQLPQDPESSVKVMREMGGWSGIINKAIDRLATENPELTHNVGSVMIHAAIARQLKLDTEIVRQTVQQHRSNHV